MIKQRGFTVIEVALVVVVIAILTGVGYIVYQRRTDNNKDNVAQAIEKANNDDSYYKMEPTKQSSPSELEKINDSDPGLKKVKSPDSPCGVDNYEILNENGQVIACTHGGI